MKGTPDIWILATTPPPVTGMTLFTDRIVRRVQSTGSVTFCNWSPGKRPRGIRFRAVRVARVLQSLAKLVRHGRARDGRLYLAANTRAGLWFTALLVFVARRLGYEIYLHHHTYTYIDRRDRRMAWISAAIADQGVHVVHCLQMEQDFRRMYPTASRFEHIAPSLGRDVGAEPRTTFHVPFTLGHLGNLSHAKGIDLVLATFVALHQESRNVRLKLAGPFYTKDAKRLVDRAIETFPDRIECVGPIFGNAKQKFLRDIDCFLFPTRNESWGIVLNEAMAAGLPVIASDRGCVRTVIGEHAGKVVGQDSEFPREAAEQVNQWMDNRAGYRAAAGAASDQAAHLDAEADRMLERFVERLFRHSDAPGGGPPVVSPACVAEGSV